MREEQQRELQVLSDADASPKLRKQYSFKDDPELAATPVVYLIGINESGKKRLRALRAKLAAEQR